MEVNMKEVVIYTTDYCPYCTKIKAFFKNKGVPFREIDLSNDQRAREDLTARTRLRTVPQVFVGETFIGGHDDTVAMDQRGELMPLIGKE
jgi:glutaredoxin 3